MGVLSWKKIAVTIAQYVQSKKHQMPPSQYQGVWVRLGGGCKLNGGGRLNTSWKLYLGIITIIWWLEVS